MILEHKYFSRKITILNYQDYIVEIILDIYLIFLKHRIIFGY